MTVAEVRAERASKPAFHTLTVAEVDEPTTARSVSSGHTEALSRLLAEMQVVARAHPRGQW